MPPINANPRLSIVSVRLKTKRPPSASVRKRREKLLPKEGMIEQVPPRKWMHCHCSSEVKKGDEQAIADSQRRKVDNRQYNTERKRGKVELGTCSYARSEAKREREFWSW